MFEWLNHNAAAVQALASVFSVIATVVLLSITRQYVGLTQELARAAREQLQRTVASESAQLTTLIDVFLGSLKRLPTSEADGDALKSVSLWKHADVSTFGSLAASVLGQRPELQRAIQRLNWIHSTADRVQQSDPKAAYPWQEFPWGDWVRQIDGSARALQAVRGDAQSSCTQEAPPPLAQRKDAQSNQTRQHEVRGHQIVQQLRKHKNQQAEDDREDRTQTCGGQYHGTLRARLRKGWAKMRLASCLHFSRYLEV